MADWNPTQWLGKALDVHICGTVKGARESEFLKMVLLDCAEATHLPELCQALGPDVVLKLFDCFAGTTIKVPSRDVITKAIRDTTIFFTISRTKEGHKSEIARDLGADYQLSEDAVLHIYVRVKKKYEAFREAECLITR